MFNSAFACSSCSLYHGTKSNPISLKQKLNLSSLVVVNVNSLINRFLTLNLNNLNFGIK